MRTASNGALRNMGSYGRSSSKYKNKKVVIDGEKFDSKHEANRWIELQYLERIGKIKFLKRQVRYDLIPPILNGKKVIQRCIYYVADFTYLADNGDGWHTVVEDAKGVKTDVYKLKKKLMRWRHGIEIQEV